MSRAGSTERALSARFNRDYYRQFYFDGRSAVTSRAEMRARATLIAGYVQHIGCPVTRLLDARLRHRPAPSPIQAPAAEGAVHRPRSQRIPCQRYGWTQGSLTDFRARPFDLVVCYDVLQYLDDRLAAQAIANLGRLCRGVLYITALTKHDWLENCDQRRTDPDVHLRTGEWYRKRLLKSFRPVGAGLWIRRGAPLVTWEMEQG